MSVDQAALPFAPDALIPPPPRHGPNDWCPHSCGCAVCVDWRTWHKARRAALAAEVAHP